MSRAILSVLGEMEAYVCESWGRMCKIYVGQGTPGTKVAPTQTATNDAKIGLRVDFGEVVIKEDGKQYQHLKLQVKKNADKAAGKPNA